MRRVILIISLGFVILFGLTSLVCRIRIDRALNTSLNMMSKNPRVAYEQIREALARNNALTFGHTNRARQIFIESLVDNAKYHLTPQAIAKSGDSFRIARQSIQMIRQIEKDAGLDLGDSRAAIIRDALETSNQIVREGTLDSWNDLVQFFNFIEGNHLIPKSMAAQYARWSEQARSTSVRRLAMRQESIAAVALLTRGLNRLGLSVHRPDEGPLALAAPTETSDTPLFDTDRDLIHAISGIDGMLNHYDDSSPEMNWFYELHGILMYNHAAIMLTHAIDKASTARQYSTGFIAAAVIRNDDWRIPPADEMYTRYMNQTYLVFAGSRFGPGATDHFTRIKNPPDRIRAYLAMTAWNAANCLERLGRDPSEYRKLANRYSEGITDSRARDMLQDMRAASRPLLIVELPEQTAE